MKNPRTISLLDSIWEQLAVEADKKGISRNQLAADIVSGFVNNNPILATASDIDLKIKQKKLDVETEKHRKLKNDNDFFEKHQYYPTKPANYITKVVEPEREPEIIYHQKSTQSIGELNKKIQTSFQQDKAEPQLTDAQWTLILSSMTKFDDFKQMYHCEVFNCVFGCQRIETAKQHIIDNHEELLQEGLRLTR